jgi:DNA-binding transcriptional ArsR family regulator
MTYTDPDPADPSPSRETRGATPAEDGLQPRRCAAALRALADPARLRLVALLRGGPGSVSLLAEAIGVEVVNASHHLGILRRAGLVQTEKRGKFVFYSLAPGVFVRSPAADHLDLGCCRLEMPRRLRSARVE